MCGGLCSLWAPGPCLHPKFVRKRDLRVAPFSCSLWLGLRRWSTASSRTPSPRPSLAEAQQLRNKSRITKRSSLGRHLNFQSSTTAACLGGATPERQHDPTPQHGGSHRRQGGLQPPTSRDDLLWASACWQHHRPPFASVLPNQRRGRGEQVARTARAPAAGAGGQASPVQHGPMGPKLVRSGPLHPHGQSSGETGARETNILNRKQGIKQKIRLFSTYI